VLLIALVAGLGVLPGVAVAAPGNQINAADMTLLNGVRLAGLWEMPAGQMAAEKGQSAKVREIGAGIATEHEELDRLTVAAANKLGATIPTDPTAEQKGWLTEMQNASGARFDQIFVTRLRVAHGKIFPVIGAVRASTRDATIRKLAEDANKFVMHHMQMLESTGLVRWPELPPAALPAPGNDSLLAAASANAGPGVGVSTTVVWLVFLAALGTGGLATYRILRRS
jgi:predicted outer membrane protein